MLNNDWISVRIADNGIGIDEKVMSRLFDPFFTTKTVGKGTGLGLSISYKIITDKHKGKIYCQSQPGLGTEFVVELPIRQILPKKPLVKVNI
jgi:signal transduction histidine kinase